MWESPGRNNNNSSSSSSRSSSILAYSGSSPSKSSSTSSSSSSPVPFSPSSPNFPNLKSATTKKSMEEVWKDITLTSLNDHSGATVISNPNSNHSAFPSMIFQDFLARPLNKEPPRRNSTVVSIAEETNIFSSLEPTPGTILSLNSGSDFQYLETTTDVDPLRPNPAVMNGHGAPSFGSPTAFPSFCKRRAQENNDNSGDRRHKRMMKNRESAARSRARKQAYTNELELEVAHLIEENAKLKRQQEKLLTAPPQLPKKNILSRSLTAPF